ncbi:hypothetical protein B0H15DRAFT_806137 [Mycena belliarum]|uniref:Transmembrane protein n=1 Tax=Mycena belliarum TaxID=1033014 RepID=A0AAD6XHP6_9AGAR|nr:hypothetical protein B0H15DRAFT_806137 [Mycena belliae]
MSQPAPERAGAQRYHVPEYLVIGAVVSSVIVVCSFGICYCMCIGVARARRALLVEIEYANSREPESVRPRLFDVYLGGPSPALWDEMMVGAPTNSKDDADTRQPSSTVATFIAMPVLVPSRPASTEAGLHAHKPINDGEDFLQQLELGVLSGPRKIIGDPDLFDLHS